MTRGTDEELIALNRLYIRALITEGERQYIREDMKGLWHTAGELAHHITLLIILEVRRNEEQR